MNRGVTREMLKGIVNKVKARIPEIAIRTTVMVGFPGETDAEFEDLREFVESMKFTHLGCFAYSQEEGTVAGRMADQVDEGVKQARLDTIMKLQKKISRSLMKEKAGMIADVLIEAAASNSPGQFRGRLSTQAPEVDGIVYLENEHAVLGKIMPVKIRSSLDYDLIGNILN
jgi:ribosomal protein S12 methylthiotransferase